MTPEERFERIEAALVRVVDVQREQAEIQREQARIQREQAEIQRQQAAFMLELAKKHADLVERVDAVIAVMERLLSRGKDG